jgi:ATP-dependent DNA helicase DinG
VLALLDSRIRRMSYGKIFLESLPPYRITEELATVEKFLESRD